MELDYAYGLTFL